MSAGASSTSTNLEKGNVTMNITACTIDEHGRQGWRYDVAPAGTIVPEWVDNATAHRVLGERGLNYGERFELLQAAERVALLELGALLEPADFELGEHVEVNAFGHWYAGEVVKIGRARITVRYTTGAGVTRDKAVNPAENASRFGSLVRKIEVAR